ncbi:hypothetical protein SH584_11965 [Sphingomonas sp. LY29]|uniref:hypothetical protein n=1 Tax=Sphingomonas sp. LY29 TaxID=3095341 RepID=UPI002D77E971|nr:hypothetical protein [Sphingomonas sp. LY29]WRP25745.1 hypothetical protein SH584_11965 [Sphingomonas sp. LY29]
MIGRFILAAILSASAATAQVAPLSFDAAKALPITAGQWVYVTTATGSEARYGNSLVIRCNRSARSVAIQRPASPSSPLNILTSSTSRAIPAGGVLNARDPILDAIAFSRGRFLVMGGVGATLAIPSWPEAARSIEDCRI